MKNAMWRVLGSRTFAAFVCVFLLGCFFTACKSEGERGSKTFVPSGTEQLLEPGGYIVGVDGFRVRAPEGALEEAVWLMIERVERPEAMPLREGGKHVGSAYRVTGRERQNFDRVPLLFELPLYEVDDPAGLAVVFLTKPGSVLDSAHDQDVWTPIDGMISEDGQRFLVSTWGLDKSGQIVGLVEGIYFTQWPSDEFDELIDEFDDYDDVSNLRRSTLSNVGFDIICEGNKDAFCDDKTVRYV